MRFYYTLLLIISLLVSFSLAQWATDVSVNLPISAGPADQNLPQITATSDGYFVLVYEDEAPGSSDIVAQKLDKAGYLLWGSGGVPVCSAPGTQRYPVIAPDSNGGVFIAWEDFRNGHQDIYAQHLDADGAATWTQDGLVISDALYQQTYPEISADGNGGAFIVWDSKQNGTVFTDIYCQRVADDGTMQWAANGVIVSAAPYSQREPKIATDFQNNAVIVWEDSRADVDYPDIYAQKLDPAGAIQWQANGAPVCVTTGEQKDPRFALDSQGNVLVAWRDDRFGVDVYAQKLDVNGNPLWNPTGVAVCTAVNSQYSPHIIHDGNSGCIISWHDFRNGSSAPFDVDVYAQRLNGMGVPQWQINGVRVAEDQDNQIDEFMIPDGKGGALISYREHPYSGGGVTDILIQRLDSSGAKLWPVGGIPVCTANRSQRQQVMASDEHHGAVVVWADEREYTANDADVYAQYINPRGEPSNAMPGLKINEIYYCGPVNNIFFFFDQYVELINTADATAYLDGKIIGRLPNSGVSDITAGDSLDLIYAFRFPGNPGDHNFPLESGNYAVIALDAMDHQQTVPTSINLENAQWEFYNQFGSDFDNPLVPNLTNINPQKSQDFLMNLRSGIVCITDGSEYLQNGDYISIPLASVLDAVEYDYDSTSAKKMYQIADAGVTGIGIDRYSGNSVQRKNPGKDTNHSNHDFEILTTPTPEIPVGIHSPRTTPNEYRLWQNYPNPFNPQTTIEFSIPKGQHVNVTIYDVTGKRVSEILDQKMQPGSHRIVWDGRDESGRNAASGIYLYRLKTSGYSAQRKLILLR